MTETTRSNAHDQEVGGKFKGLGFGSGRPLIIAGPCSVESEEQILSSAHAVKAAGATALRGGAYKPRTTPRSFQGLEKEGLELLAMAKQQTGLPIVTEVMDAAQIDMIAQYADVLQVGSRNMQNFALLKQVGRAGLPVMLKRGLSATVSEWLGAAEYITASGNDQVIMCERGIRTFETHTRNTLDLSAAIAVRRISGFPVIVDPSHAAGRRDLIGPLSHAALAAGADGLMIEVHPDPAQALSDADQQLDFAAFRALMLDLGLLPVAALQSLDECRSEIDRVDVEILAMLERRMKISGRIGGLKHESGLQTLQIERENLLIEALAQRSSATIGGAGVQSIWRPILELSRSIQAATNSEPNRMAGD